MTNSVLVTGWVHGDRITKRDGEFVTSEFHLTLRPSDGIEPAAFVPVWCDGPTAIEAGRLAPGDRVEVTGCLSALASVRTDSGCDAGRIEVIAWRLAVPIPPVAPELAPDAHLEAAYEDREEPRNNA